MRTEIVMSATATRVSIENRGRTMLVLTDGDQRVVFELPATHAWTAAHSLAYRIEQASEQMPR